MDGTKKKFILGYFVILFLIGNIENCKEPTSPERTPPEEPTYYTIQIKYVRPPGSITRPDLAWKGAGAMIIGQCISGPCVFDFSFYDRADEYHFNWSEPKSIPDNERGIIYQMWGIDEGRWDGVNDDTGVVGDIFFVRVVETGFEKQLANVKENTHPLNAHPGPNARMVQWRLMQDGTVRDE